MDVLYYDELQQKATIKVGFIFRNEYQAKKFTVQRVPPDYKYNRTSMKASASVKLYLIHLKEFDTNTFINMDGYISKQFWNDNLKFGNPTLTLFDTL
jgi:hypothetical protein